MPKSILAVIVLTICISLTACESHKHITIEDQAQAIDKLLVCPVCPAETIDQAQVPLAKDMRELVRKKLDEGWSKQQILEYFSDEERYGPGVLSSPPKSGANAIIWFVPAVGFVLSIIVLILILKAMARTKHDAIHHKDNETTLTKYLDEVDRTLRND